ncbi:hypothetical protein FGO68_gene8640 [Halteria grandinella]|uniref:Uncharacterized protein n=1 Tax=Halteria grandinella TaxID=5974 RepID=A0A8J8T452_HALGN|nr:hypothetical protein FGO68_gene8640 [Halteria grandinella]
MKAEPEKQPAKSKKGKHETLKTDSMIAQEKSSTKPQRELVRYIPDTSVPLTQQLGDDTAPYDQFEMNQRLYGTKSTYNFELYTTKLDESKVRDA